MRVIANAQLEVVEGDGRSLLASGAFAVVRDPEPGSDVRQILVYQGGELGTPPKDLPSIVLELDAIELRYLVVAAMQCEGVEMGAPRLIDPSGNPLL